MKQQKKELNNIRVLFGCFLFGVSPPKEPLIESGASRLW